MFEFQHPLWLLLLAPLLLVALLGHGRRVAARWSSFSLFTRKRSLRVALAWLPRSIELLAIAGAIVAMARPQLVNTERVVRSEGIDIVLALDVSGSMEAMDFAISGRPVDRLTVAKRAVADFVKGRPHDRLGLVVFGEEAFTQVPLTLDHDALLNFLDRVEIGMAGANRTAIGEALAIAGRRLGSVDAPSRVLVLLTDGQSNAGTITPNQAAEALEALDITLYTVGVGGEGGRGLFRRTEEVDEATLTEIAELTGGRYFRARDTEGLERVYATIDRLEKSTAEVEELTSRVELFHRFLWPSLVALLFSWGLSESYLRRLP